MYTRFWTVFNHLALFLTSIGLYLIFMIYSNYMTSSYAYMTPINLLTTVYFYFTQMMTLGLIVFVDEAIFITIK